MTEDPWACPTCGCRDSRPDASRTRPGEPIAHRRCRHCGGVWKPKTLPETTPVTRRPELDEVVHYPAPVAVQVRCPQCNCPDTRVTSTRRPIRWHKCDSCGTTFKSCEKT